MPSPVRSWTVDEANAALGWVGGVVARAQDLWQRYRGQASRRARLVRQNGHGLVPADPAAIQECLDELAAEGVVLRDIDRGLDRLPGAGAERALVLVVLAGGRGRRHLVALARGRLRRPDARSTEPPR